MVLEKNPAVRVRFAPSPTGNLHIGGLRTALFNYLFAKHNGGSFLLRVEDTDKERSKKEFTDAQMASLSWVGITSDEELMFQSERTAIYQELLDILLLQKKLYRCICTDQEREARARAAGCTDDFYRYDEFCRDKNIQSDSDKPFVIRFALPQECKEIIFKDHIRGTVVFSRDQLDDFIIVRSDGSPTYNFVVVVDDNAMKISHVIRGEEHLGNTPKQILIADACGYTHPQWAHIPLILSPHGGKLSKRDGSVDVRSYKKDGYLPDALINYLARLGWACGDKEVFSPQELQDLFTLDGVGKKGAVFDTKKLDWLNALYIKQLNPDECIAWLVKDIDTQLLEKTALWSDKQRSGIVALYQERATTGKDLSSALIELHASPQKYEEQAVAKWLNKDSLDSLALFVGQLEQLETFTVEMIKETLKAFCLQHNLKLGMLAQPIRIALTGVTESPGVFDLLALLQKEESIKRIKKMIQNCSE